MASSSPKEQHVIASNPQGSGNRECPASMQKVGPLGTRINRLFFHCFASPRIH
jgi:hypothetical protein